MIAVCTCPTLRQCAGRTLHLEVVKATAKLFTKPVQNVPKKCDGRFEAMKASLKPLKLARDHCAKSDQDKSNVDKQGYGQEMDWLRI